MLRIAELSFDDEHWNEAVATFPEATLFHTAPWLRLLERHKGAEWQKYGIYAGERLVGLYPLLATRKGVFRLAVSPLRGWATPYLGPLVEEPYWGDLPAALRRFLQRKGFDYTEMVFWGTAYRAELEAAGYVCEDRFTYINDLSQGPDALWKGLKCRTDVRKALKNGLTIEESDDPSHFAQYEQLAIETYDPHGRPPLISPEMIADAWSTLRPLGQIKLWVVRHEGQPIAYELVLYFNGRIYYWDAVAARETLKLRPSNLSTWTIMEAAAKEGYQVSDLVGAEMPGIARFKKSFGGTLEAYTYAYCYLNPLARFGRTVYKRSMPLLLKGRQIVNGLRREKVRSE